MQDNVASLLERLACSADVYVRGMVARDAVYIPQHLRAAVVEVSEGLAGILDALFGIQALHDDAFVLKALAQSPPPPGDIREIAHQRVLTTHLRYLEVVFSAGLRRLADEFNGFLHVTSADEEPIELDRIVERAGVRWLVAAPSGTAAAYDVAQMWPPDPEIASRSPREWPPLAAVSDRARSELLLRVQDRCEGMEAVLAIITETHGPALLELIERHNVMIRNFEQQMQG
ncbi:hypothetical protein AB7783_26625 [Tardiphaga sp. 172_B4_N1_3]|uniref:hypothetical protein n=1 Tax=Tardiphaga sp. 172_B4_N1_3 TaxID=3240787 RepID=UPI003F8B45E5